MISAQGSGVHSNSRSSPVNKTAWVVLWCLICCWWRLSFCRWHCHLCQGAEITHINYLILLFFILKRPYICLKKEVNVQLTGMQFFWIISLKQKTIFNKETLKWWSLTFAVWWTQMNLNYLWENGGRQVKLWEQKPETWEEWQVWTETLSKVTASPHHVLVFLLSSTTFFFFFLGGTDDIFICFLTQRALTRHFIAD